VQRHKFKRKHFNQFLCQSSIFVDRVQLPQPENRSDAK